MLPEKKPDLARRRALRTAGALTLLGSVPLSSRALMAGTAPDSPEARVDANTASSPWSGEVSVVVNGSPYSGTVIGAQHVLTAAHVVGAGTAPGIVQVVVNAAATPVTMQVIAVASYPTASFPYDDLTVLTLAQPVPAGTAVYPIVDTPRPTGTVVTLVGYGASGSGATGVSVNQSSTVKRKGRNTVDALPTQLDASGRSSPFFVYDFDGNTGYGPLGGRTLGNAAETCVAGGDSGSGVFLEDGVPALYGMSTFNLSFTQGVPAQPTFGFGGGGVVLSHPPYLEWLLAQTAGQMTMLSQANSSDSVPVAPGWGLGLLGSALAWQLARRRATGPGHG